MCVDNVFEYADVKFPFVCSGPFGAVRSIEEVPGDIVVSESFGEALRGFFVFGYIKNANFVVISRIRHGLLGLGRHRLDLDGRTDFLHRMQKVEIRKFLYR